ncbi:ABC transporter substrate-binding protein [Yinghuangia sp. YIM S10712]|uniref:ABC transporter substrate-binding protein n=1 Tax=Yinghuangia sp. YIM S10712 TaxID=3436930 RepID=UPI003F5367D1
MAITAVAAVIATGCAGEKNDDAPSATGSTVVPPAPDVAPGVTEDSIKVGITYPDLSSVKQFMNIDHGDYEVVYRALIQKINADGGINGRKIEPVFGKINVVSPATAQEACRQLTQDAKVFAAIGSFNADESLCYVQADKTAVVGGPLTAKYYAQAQAPWFSYDRGGDEVADGIELFAQNGAFAGKKVGVVGVVNEQSLVKDVVVPALQRRGVTPVQTAILDASLRDPAAVAQRTDAIIRQLQAAGADTIVVVGGMGQAFPVQLEKTGYRPRLLFTNLSTAEIYTGDNAQHDRGVLTNAAALGPLIRWDEPDIRRCVATVEAAVPTLRDKLYTDARTLPAGSPTPQVAVETACRALTLFTGIATKAGRDLTYASFQKAGFTLGPLRIASYVDPADYSRDTPHGAIPPRTYTYDPEANKFQLSFS